MGHMTPFRCEGNCFCKCQCFLTAEIGPHETLACHERVAGSLKRSCNGTTESLDPLDYGIYSTIDSSENETLYAGPLGEMPSAIRVRSGVTYNVSVYQWHEIEFEGTGCQEFIPGADDSYTFDGDESVECDCIPDNTYLLCNDPYLPYYQYLEVTIVWTGSGVVDNFNSFPGCDPSGTYLIPTGDCGVLDVGVEVCRDDSINSIMVISHNPSTGLTWVRQNNDGTVFDWFEATMWCINEEETQGPYDVFGSGSPPPPVTSITITARFVWL
jgi:hypothetical protein